MKKNLIGALIILTTLNTYLPVAGQDKKSSMSQQIVHLYYVTPGEIYQLLEAYKSKDGTVTLVSNNPSEENVIILNDYPENLANMLGIIKEMDVRIPDMVFTIQLILGTEGISEKTDEALTNDPAIKELKSFLKFKTYNLLDTSLMRALNRQYSRTTLGPKGEFELWLRPRYSKKDNTEWIQLELRLEQRQGVRTQKETQQEGNKTVTTEQDRMVSDTVLNSNLTLKAGEKTVVGVSRTLGGEKGLILIILGKTLH